MKSKLLGLTLFAVIFTSIAFSAEAHATNSKVDLYSIMETYHKKTEQAKADFLATVKKINSDSRTYVKEGVLSMGEINARSKAAMQDAKDQMHLAVQKAREDVKENLYMLKASIHTHRHNTEI